MAKYEINVGGSGEGGEGDNKAPKYRINIEGGANTDVTVGDGQVIEQSFTAFQKPKTDETTPDKDADVGVVITGGQGVQINKPGVYKIEGGQGIVIGHNNKVNKD